MFVHKPSQKIQFEEYVFFLNIPCLPLANTNQAIIQ